MRVPREIRKAMAVAASIGGRARAKKLSPERRREIAMIAVRARQAKIAERKRLALMAEASS